MATDYQKPTNHRNPEPSEALVRTVSHPLAALRLGEMIEGDPQETAVLGPEPSIQQRLKEELKARQAAAAQPPPKRRRRRTPKTGSK